MASLRLADLKPEKSLLGICLHRIPPLRLRLLRLRLLLLLIPGGVRRRWF